MKINDPLGNQVSSAAKSQEVTSAGQSRTRPAGLPPASSDQVELSRLSHYLNLLRPESPQHASEIARLRATVTSGEYHVDPPTLSKSIIQAHLAA